LEKGWGKELTVEEILLQIQKIQTFLICSEHFDSELIRGTFELFREKQMKNIPGRLTLLGENFALVDQGRPIKKIVRGINSIKGDGPANLTIVNVNSLEFHFDGGQIDGDLSFIDDIPVSVNQ
jgi:hypothetical protein